MNTSLSYVLSFSFAICMLQTRAVVLWKIHFCMNERVILNEIYSKWFWHNKEWSFVIRIDMRYISIIWIVYRRFSIVLKIKTKYLSNRILERGKKCSWINCKDFTQYFDAYIYVKLISTIKTDHGVKLCKVPRDQNMFCFRINYWPS